MKIVIFFFGIFVFFKVDFRWKDCVCMYSLFLYYEYKLCIGIKLDNGFKVCK